MDRASVAFQASGIKDGIERLAKLYGQIQSTTHPASLVVRAQNARDVILEELEKRKFLRVSGDRRQYLDRKQAFGEKVAKNFKTAAGDIREAGNCLAVECCTASVFHLMRAAEVALRALAADRGVTFSKGTLDSKQWGEIINKLEGYAGDLGKVDATKWPSEKVRQTQIRFYQGALIEFRAFNDAWRRHLSHAHEGAFYDRDQAMSVMTHTKQFMQQLAVKISEDTTMPEFWTIT